MYAGYGSGEEHIKNKEPEKQKQAVPYIGFNYNEMWIGESALKNIVKIGEKFSSYLIKILFIMVFLIMLKISYSIT